MFQFVFIFKKKNEFTPLDVIIWCFKPHSFSLQFESSYCEVGEKKLQVCDLSFNSVKIASGSSLYCINQVCLLPLCDRGKSWIFSLWCLKSVIFNHFSSVLLIMKKSIAMTDVSALRWGPAITTPSTIKPSGLMYTRKSLACLSLIAALLSICSWLSQQCCCFPDSM